MFRPLLRTMPSLAGNVKLACFLTDYNEIDKHIFESNVRTARLTPISSQLYTKFMDISLLKSSYEWDLPKFYKYYPNCFYKKNYDYNQSDAIEFNPTGLNKNRNTDFEFGVKRISYQKHNKQLAFFAPIYIEGVDDIPDYFEILIEISNKSYKTTRTIRVNINDYSQSTNYLGNYIYNFASGIDENVIFLNKDQNKGVYYGIDIDSGGFTNKHDHNLYNIFNNEHTIHNFDNLINKGFERNLLVMKQILPLSFYFSLNDILSETEKQMFYGAELHISGKWYKGGSYVPLKDFLIDYTSFSPRIPQINTKTGELLYSTSQVLNNGEYSNINIMNIDYPSLRESMFYKYRFSNKITPNFNRWKLKYSDDSNPYIINNSVAFSLYQKSLSKYGQFPSLYDSVTGIVTKKPYYLNLILPLNGGEKKYPDSTVSNYKKIINNYATNWFELYDSLDNLFDKCIDCKDNKAFFNGILYSFNSINDSVSKDINIDKFGMFVKPDFQIVDTQSAVYSDYVIFKENSEYITKSNCHIDDNMLSQENARIFSNLTTNVKQDQFSHNQVFIKNENGDGDFISLADYGIDWFECNDFVTLSEIQDLLDSDIISSYIYKQVSSQAVDGFSLVPICKVSNVDGSLFNSNNINLDDLSSLYIADMGSTSKLEIKFEDNSLKDIDNEPYKKVFYKRDNFIDRRNVKDIISTYALFEIQTTYFNYSYNDCLVELEKYVDNVSAYISSLSSYQYNPILTTGNNEVYGYNTFVCNRNSVSELKYCDKLPQDKWNKDKDFLYVDSYNLNNIIHHYNTTWLKDDNVKLAYIVNAGEFYPKQTPDHTLIRFVGDTQNITNRLDIGKTITTDISTIELIDVLYNYYIDYEIVNYPYSFNTIGIDTEINGRKIVWRDENKHYVLKAKIMYSYPKYYSLYNKVFDGNLGYSTKEEVEDYIKNNKVYIKDETGNVKEYSYILLVMILGYFYENPYKIGNIERADELRICALNMHVNNIVDSQVPYLYLSDWNADDLYCKFLNKLHLKWYLKQLYKDQDADYVTDSEKSLDALLDTIYYRKRVFDNNFNISDKFYPIKDIYQIGYSKNEDNDNAIVDKFLESINFNESKDKFYFDDVDEEYELVFKKRMIKINDFIWKLINLDQEHAAPYKDLYIYRLQKDEEYNNLIEYDSSEPSKRGVYTPFFNLALIETKEQSRIYSEYSINNITPCEWVDFSMVSSTYYSKVRHFYRYNSNNELVMYDLSTINKKILQKIGSYQYYYPSELSEDELYNYAYTLVSTDLYDNKESHSEAVTKYVSNNYIPFHDTFDLYGHNNIEFRNTYSSYTESVITGTNKYNAWTYSYYSFICDQAEYDSYLDKAIEIDQVNHIIHTPDGKGILWESLDNVPPDKPKYKLTFATSSYDELSEDIYEDQEFYTYYNDLDLYEDYKLNTYQWADGTTYAWYDLNVGLNNTTNCLNIQSYTGEYLKYVSYINGQYLLDSDTSMIYKQMIPFIKKSPLSYVFNYCDTLVNPYIYSLDLKYKANKVEESYYDINKQSTFDTITMSRYFDYIQPVFEERSIISSYNMKYKNTKKGLKVAYYTNESIYPLNMSINNYPGIRLYDMKGDQQSYIITSDPEYKHFNDNHYINLEESFTYIFETELTTAQVLYYETETSCKNIFKDHIERYSMSDLDEDTINWIYNKYQVSVGCTPSSLNASLDEKLYKLELYYELY